MIEWILANWVLIAASLITSGVIILVVFFIFRYFLRFPIVMHLSFWMIRGNTLWRLIALWLVLAVAIMLMFGGTALAISSILTGGMIA